MAGSPECEAAEQVTAAAGWLREGLLEAQQQPLPESFARLLLLWGAKPAPHVHAFDAIKRDPKGDEAIMKSRKQTAKKATSKKQHVIEAKAAEKAPERAAPGPTSTQDAPADTKAAQKGQGRQEGRPQPPKRRARAARRPPSST